MSIVRRSSIPPRCLSVDPFLLGVSVSLQAQSQNLDLMQREKKHPLFFPNSAWQYLEVFGLYV